MAVMGRRGTQEGARKVGRGRIVVLRLSLKDPAWWTLKNENSSTRAG